MTAIQSRLGPAQRIQGSGSSSDGRLQFVKIAGVDTSDNIYYTASAPYDTQNSIYVVKQNKNGTIVWSRKLIPPGGRSVYRPTAIMDSSNNIYIAFSYSYLGTYTLEFVKYNSSGVIQVQTQATQSYSGIPYWSMAQDSNGDIWVVGTTQDDYRLYTYKFSSAGTLLNTRYFTNFMGFSNVASAGIYAGEAGYMYYD
ncbi:MAG: hypothetical protein EBU69_03315, partial [Methylophilaceae bacterium]|nr:hypothetical protein [Methylophilaceae bacterium]